MLISLNSKEIFRTSYFNNMGYLMVFTSMYMYKVTFLVPYLTDLPRGEANR